MRSQSGLDGHLGQTCDPSAPRRPSGRHFGPLGTRFWPLRESILKGAPGPPRNAPEAWAHPCWDNVASIFSRLPCHPEAFRTPLWPPRGSILAGSILGLPVDQPCFPIFVRLGCEHAGTSSAAGSTGIGCRGAAFRILVFWKTCLVRWFAFLFRAFS